MKSSRTTLARLMASLLTVALLAGSLVGCAAPGEEPGPGGPTGAQMVVSNGATNAVTSIDVQGPGGTTTHNLTLAPGQEAFLPLGPGNYQATFWVYVGGGFSVIDLTPRHFTVDPNQITVVHYP